MKRSVGLLCLVATWLGAAPADDLNLLSYQLLALAKAVPMAAPRGPQRMAPKRPALPTEVKRAEHKAAMQGIVIGNIKVPIVGKIQLVNILPAEAEALGKEALAYTNKFRAEHGLPPLKWDADLAAAALPHSEGMALGTVPWSHEGFEQRIAGLPRKAYGAAENLFKALNYPKEAMPKVAVEGWIKSPGHRANLLLQDMPYCGIGVCKNSLNEWYYTQIFGKF